MRDPADDHAERREFFALADLRLHGALLDEIAPHDHDPGNLAGWRRSFATGATTPVCFLRFDTSSAIRPIGDRRFERSRESRLAPRDFAAPRCGRRARSRALPDACKPAAFSAAAFQVMMAPFGSVEMMRSPALSTMLARCSCIRRTSSPSCKRSVTSSITRIAPRDPPSNCSGQML